MERAALLVYVLDTKHIILSIVYFLHQSAYPLSHLIIHIKRASHVYWKLEITPGL